MKRNSPTLQKTETPFNRTNYLIMLAGYLLVKQDSAFSADQSPQKSVLTPTSSIYNAPL